jgi:hypothetical protein
MEFCLAKLQLKQWKQRHPCRKPRLSPQKAQNSLIFTQIWAFLYEASYPGSEVSYLTSEAPYSGSEASYLASEAPYPQSEGSCLESEGSYPQSEGSYPGNEAPLVLIGASVQRLNHSCVVWNTP